MVVVIMFAMGNVSSDANILIIFAGISFLTVEDVVLSLTEPDIHPLGQSVGQNHQRHIIVFQGYIKFMFLVTQVTG